MKALIVLAVVVVVTIYGGINYYIGLRSWQNLWQHVPFLSSKLYWVVFSLIALAYIIFMLLPAFIPSFISYPLDVIGSYWMAIMFYLIMILPIVDLIRLSNKKLMFLPKNFSENTRSPLILSAILITFIFAILIYGTWCAYSPKVTKYTLSINKQAGTIKHLKVIMLSDIHLGEIVNNSRLTTMVNDINELKPDLVLLPGDIIDSSLAPFIKENMGANFKRINSKYGVYACFGNHDGMRTPVNEVVKNFENAGIKVLRDTAVLVDNSFYIIGRDDISLAQITKSKRKPLSELTETLDKSKPILLMDHQPRNLKETAQEGVDLEVSGHTHKGQFYPVNFITSKIFEIDYGYLKKDNSNIIVSSGYGTWGPPIRLGSRSEIVEIDMNFNH